MIIQNYLTSNTRSSSVGGTDSCLSRPLEAITAWQYYFDTMGKNCQDVKREKFLQCIDEAVTWLIRMALSSLLCRVNKGKNCGAKKKKIFENQADFRKQSVS